jgi:hypothetical protein
MKSNVLKITKWIFISPAILVLLAVAFCEINKAYWDHQVKLMCEKDGGVTIYEKVVIYKSDYKNIKTSLNGEVILPFEKQANPEDPFFIRYSFDFIHDGFVSVKRGETYFIRNNDKKILSKQVLYTRGGGDFPIGFEGSRYVCEKWNEYHEKIASTITVKGE